MKYLLLSVLTLSLSNVSFAADKKTVAAKNPKVDMTQMGKIDQETLDVEPKNKNPEDVDLVTDEHDMKVSVDCKLKNGTIIKQGQPGYEACLQDVRVKNGSNDKAGADVNVKIGN